MSTKISGLTERYQSDINGSEFFPIIDADSQTPTSFHTYKITLDELFVSGIGYEKVTGIAVTGGATVQDDNETFTLTYSKEDNSTDVLTIEKYKILDNDVKFSHIDPVGYITSVEKVSNNIVDTQLVTSAAVEQHRIYREGIYDDAIKLYFGDADTLRDSNATHVLADFRLNTEVAADFVTLKGGVTANFDTLGKIEIGLNELYQVQQIKIGTNQVNTSQFTIDPVNLSKRLNIKNLGIVTALINNKAVINSKIADGAVNNIKLGNKSISTSKIQNSAIITQHIADDAVTTDKLSQGAPSWNSTTVNIPGRLTVASSAVFNGSIRSNSTDFYLYNSTRAGGNVHSGRALVHGSGDKLIVNYGGDYTGGTDIFGRTRAPQNSQTAILGGDQYTVATKGYVDYADIRIRPLDPSRIQNDCIQLRHMSDDSVSTSEIIDGSITTAKIDAKGPHWDTGGNTQLEGNLTTFGKTLQIGRSDDANGFSPAMIKLYSDGKLGYVMRKPGKSGEMVIGNSTGNVAINISGNVATFSQSKATLATPLVVGGTFTTIAGENHSNPLLQLGDKTGSCLSMDDNEIQQKSNNLYLGVDAGRTINFRADGVWLGRFDGRNKRFEAEGDIIAKSGRISQFVNTESLNLLGGTSANTGADIALYGTQSTSNSGVAQYSANSHVFKSVDGKKQFLTINGITGKLSINVQGTADNDLVNKQYVDDNVFKDMLTLDDISTRMKSGFYQTSNAQKDNGWPESTNSWYHMLSNTHSNTSNYNALQFAAPYYDQEMYFRSTSGNGKKEWNKVWHSNNVGKDSGLDADLLDGKHAHAFSLTSHNHDSTYRKKEVKIIPSDLSDNAPYWNATDTVLYNNVTVSSDAYGRYTNQLKARTVAGSTLTDSPLEPNRGEKSRALVLSCGDETIGNVGSTSLMMFGLDYDSTIYAGAFSGRGKKIMFSTSSSGSYSIRVQRFIIDENGLITAPTLTKAQISSNNKALVTTEYVAEEISKVFPDDHYLPSTKPVLDTPLTITGSNLADSFPSAEDSALYTEIPGSSFTPASCNLWLKPDTAERSSGILFSAANQNGNAPHPASFSARIWPHGKDKAWIQYHTDGIDGTVDSIGHTSELVIGVGSNSYGTDIEGHFANIKDNIVFDIPHRDALVARLYNNYSGNSVRHKVWHAGNDGAWSGLDADKLDGLESTAFIKTSNPAFNTASNSKPLVISRVGTNTQALSIGLDDNIAHFNYVNDENATNFEFKLASTDTERSTLKGLEANTGIIKFTSNKDVANITITHSSDNVANKVWHEGNVGSGSGLDADKLDGLESTAFARPNTRFNVLEPASAKNVATKKYVDDNVSDNASRLDGASLSSIANNTTQSRSAIINRPTGWYVIATNSGNRAIARFGLRDTRSGRHQSIIFNASHHFGEDTSNNLTVTHNSHYRESMPMSGIRISEGSTYQGAVLQVYVSNASNDLDVFLLGDNFQSGGWVLADWIPADGYAPHLNVEAEIDLKGQNGGFFTTDEIYAGGQKEQYEVWNDGNVTNKVTTDTINGKAVTTSKIADGAINTTKLGWNAVTTSKIAEDAVGISEIAPGAVTNEKIADDAVTHEKIADDAVTTSKIASKAVGNLEIGNDAVTSRNIKSGHVGSSEIADNAITASKIASDAVGTSEIARNAVTADEIAPSAVGSSEIASGAVGSSEIANGAVNVEKISAILPGKLLGKGHGAAMFGTNYVDIDKSISNTSSHISVPSTKAVFDHVGDTVGRAIDDAVEDLVIAANKDIPDNSITADKLAEDAVGSSEIAAGAVGTSEILDEAITASKIADDAILAQHIKSGQVGSSEIASNAVGSSEIANNAVGSSEIAAGAVRDSEIATDAILARHIKSGQVGASEIASNAVTNDKIGSKAVGNLEIADDAILARNIKSGQVGSSEIASNAVTNAKIGLKAVGNSEIADNAITASKIADNAITNAKIANNAVRTSEIADGAVTEGKLADVDAGFILGRGHDQQDGSPNKVAIAKSISNTSTHNSVPSAQAVRDYVKKSTFGHTPQSVGPTGTTTAAGTLIVSAQGSSVVVRSYRSRSTSRREIPAQINIICDGVTYRQTGGAGDNWQGIDSYATLAIPMRSGATWAVQSGSNVYQVKFIRFNA